MTLPARAARRTRLLRLVVALSCLAAAGCSRQAVLEKLSSPEDRAFGGKVVQALQTGDAGFIEANLEPDLREKMVPLFPAMRALTPTGADATVTLIDARFNVMTTTGDGTTRNAFLAYEVDQASRHVVVKIAILRQGPSAQIAGLYVAPLAKPASETDAFTLKGKSAVQLLFLALAILSPLTILAGLVALFTTRGIRRKWLWTIGCLFGVGQFAIDWSSGVISFRALNVQLLGGFALKAGALEPWQVGFGIPVVAIILLVFRRRIAAHDTQVPPAGRPG
jgi:hypothetical protein